jgi:hypothetical protein
LTDIERAFITRRLGEEQTALEKLSSETFPVTFSLPAGLPSTGEASHV